MRKWHRWLSFLFGAFILFIAATGVLSQIGSHLLFERGGVEPAAADLGALLDACPGVTARCGSSKIATIRDGSPSGSSGTSCSRSTT